MVFFRKSSNGLFTCSLILFVLAVISIAFSKSQVGTLFQSEITTNAINLHEACKESKRGQLCYTDRFEDIVRERELPYTLALLEKLQSYDPSTRDCHFIAHVIAFAEVEKHPNTWEELFATLPLDACTGGFLMGVLEGHALKSDLALTEKTVPEICDRITKKQSSKYDIQSVASIEQSCVHIMGHLLLAEYLDIDQALAICALLPTHEVYECYAGVFMESLIQRNIAIHTGKEPAQWTKALLQKREKRCREYQNIVAKACWRELAHMIVSLEAYRPSLVFASCMQAPEETFQDECYIHAVGIIAVTDNGMDDTKAFLCKPYKLRDSRARRCMTMVINSMLGSSPTFTQNASLFCATLRGEQQNDCLALVNKRVLDK